MTKRERVSEAIEDMLSTDLIDVWNMYCDKGNNLEDRYLYMEEFNELFYGCTPLKIAEVVYDEDFNPNHEYFKEGIYGVTSYEDAWSCVCDMDTDMLIDYIVDNDESFRNQDLRIALSEDDGEDEDEDES